MRIHNSYYQVVQAKVYLFAIIKTILSNDLILSHDRLVNSSQFYRNTYFFSKIITKVLLMFVLQD